MARIGEVSHAIAEAVNLCEPKVIAMYPITPQTHIVEALAEIVDKKQLKSEIIRAESEHSTISCLVGASATGVRTFTASDSQGLALMHEVLHIAAGMRLPIVMVVCNRALSAPINIWCDHSDIMSQRDTGWIQLFCKDGQEAYDTIFQAYAIAEKVSLPVMVNIDGFTLSNVFEPVNLLTKPQVKKYLPSFKMKHKLDPNSPKTLGPVGYPEHYWQFKKQQKEAMIQAKSLLPKECKKFKTMFKRKYKENGLSEGTNLKAKKIIVLLGATAGTVEEYIKKNKNIGLLRIKSFRPFPYDAVQKILKNKQVIVFDRAYSYGAGGPLYLEIRSILPPKNVKSVILGLGGKDITFDTIKKSLNSKGELWL